MESEKRLHRYRRWTWHVLILTLIGAPAYARPPSPTETPKAEQGSAHSVATESTSPALHDSVVAVDPATGQLREPTAAELAALKQAAPPMRTNGRVIPRDVNEAARTVRRLDGGGYEIQMPQSLMENLEYAVPAAAAGCNARGSVKSCQAQQENGHD
ncbi:post-PEP-CTERM-1 domain-containing protein [Lysobacter sp. CA199]|uniref:post-PEP-CTERM-1 domain-containing protein n=1 Tax=Lysobacter sp. CA199 TaxID=3455608 RepID=UPI003F8D69DC